eukprot:g29833.t1
MENMEFKVGLFCHLNVVGDTYPKEGQVKHVHVISETNSSSSSRAQTIAWHPLAAVPKGLLHVYSLCPRTPLHMSSFASTTNAHSFLTPK